MKPTLYLMGDQDYMFLPQVIKLVSNYENSRLAIISDCGHVCNVEQPEEFNTQSINFISNHTLA